MAGVGNFWAAKIFSLTFSAFLQLTFPYINIFLHFASALPITFQMVHALGMFLSLFQSLFNLALCFSASFQTFCLTARAYLNTQKYGLFCSLHHFSFWEKSQTESLRALWRPINRKFEKWKQIEKPFLKNLTRSQYWNPRQYSRRPTAPKRPFMERFISFIAIFAWKLKLHWFL